MSYVLCKLSHHKTVIGDHGLVGDYGFIFLKWLETVVTNHDFNFKFKVAISDYAFEFFKKWSKS